MLHIFGMIFGGPKVFFYQLLHAWKVLACLACASVVMTPSSMAWASLNQEMT